jgi:hypothetical protein
MQAAAELASLLTEPHVYTHSTRRKLVLIFVLVAIIIFLAMAVVNLISRQNIVLILAGIVEVLFFAAMGFILSQSIRGNVLITGLEGIIFTYGGYTVFSPWENITRITRPPYWRRYEALQLRETPADIPLEDGIREHQAAMQITRSAMITMGPKSKSPYDIYHYIPLLFTRNSRYKDQLNSDLERYLPTILQAPSQRTLHR